MHLHNLFTMGGYGLYVWTTYSITLLVVGINAFTTVREKRRVKKTLRQHLNQPS